MRGQMSRNLQDVYFPGTARLYADAYAEKFVPTYLFSFVVGFVFGELMDLHELWITRLPVNLPLRVLYFVLSYLILCFGIALSKRCKLPIVPTDLFPREVSDITKVPYSRIKSASM